MKKRPEKVEPVSEDEIIEHLVTKGLRVKNAEELIEAIRRIKLLAHYYYFNGLWEQVREHEIRSFLILPLLIALGWSEQQIKIEFPIGERQRVDIACFSAPFFSQNKRCSLLVEAKGFAYGLNYATEEAKIYVKQFAECNRIVVSNGYCYKVFKRTKDGSFPELPYAYVNILKPKRRYPLNPEEVNGALEAFTELIPYMDSGI